MCSVSPVDELHALGQTLVKINMFIQIIHVLILVGIPPPSGGFYNEIAKSMTSLCSANNLADFIMSLQNL